MKIKASGNKSKFILNFIRFVNIWAKIHFDLLIFVNLEGVNGKM
jgi:hypothetical protein